MCAITLNSLLTSCGPVLNSSESEIMPYIPSDFAQRYYHEVGNHAQALWLVLPKFSDIRYAHTNSLGRRQRHSVSELA